MSRHLDRSPLSASTIFMALSIGCLSASIAFVLM